MKIGEVPQCTTL